jgi:hypothetical protein
MLQSTVRGLRTTMRVQPLGFRNLVEIGGHRTKSRAGDLHYLPLTFGITF